MRRDCQADRVIWVTVHIRATAALGKVRRGGKAMAGASLVAMRAVLTIQFLPLVNADLRNGKERPPHDEPLYQQINPISHRELHSRDNARMPL